jgi:hypothetical protein
MRWLLLAVLSASGCAGDACAGFSGETCVSLEVRGSTLVDQLRIIDLIIALDAFSPPAPRATPAALPIRLPVLFGRADGNFVLTVHAFLAGDEVGNGQVSGSVEHGGHTSAVVRLDVGHVDLSGVDLPPSGSFDLALDLASTSCNTATQAPCTSSQKCIFTGGAPSCVPLAGSHAIGEGCNTFPDDCARGLQCLNPGGSGMSVCMQLCSGDSNCNQPPVAVGSMAEPNNKSYCRLNVAGPSTPALCTLACNPVAALPPSGCPTGDTCVYTSAGFPLELTFCDAPGTPTLGQACGSRNDCGIGLACASGTCRQVCRFGHDEDCMSGGTCTSFASMFGFCCPGGAC